MATLAPIINSTETIAAAFQSSINAAFTELHAVFGFWPRVLSPYGGARTQAECDHEGTSWKISDHYQDAGNRAAVDIDNQSDFRRINTALFVNTLAKYGWHNITTSGQPFPKEPWHFAKHGISTAGESVTPIDNTKTMSQEDESMTPRTVTLDGGKTFIIQFQDGTSKPLIDYRTGQPMNSATVKALNQYLRYTVDYYPNGVAGAAVMAPDVFHQFSLAIDPTGAKLA